MREFGADVVVDRSEHRRIEASEVLVERVDEDPERHVTLELGARAREHQMTALFGALGELRQHARLPDPGLPYQRERGGLPAVELSEREVDKAELVGAADEPLESDHRHVSPSLDQPREKANRLKDQGAAPMSRSTGAAS